MRTPNENERQIAEILLDRLKFSEETQTLIRRVRNGQPSGEEAMQQMQRYADTLLQQLRPA
jgi:RecB family endonuclease NucS